MVILKHNRDQKFAFYSLRSTNFHVGLFPQISYTLIQGLTFWVHSLGSFKLLTVPLSSTLSSPTSSLSCSVLKSDCSSFVMEWLHTPSSVQFLKTVPTAFALFSSAGRRFLRAVSTVIKVTWFGTTESSLIISLYMLTNIRSPSLCSIESLSVYAHALITAV